MVEALQAGDKYKIATPVNWQPGQDVIVNAAVSNDDAKKLFPDYKSPLVRRAPSFVQLEDSSLAV